MLPISSFVHAITKPIITKTGKKMKRTNSLLSIAVGLKPSPIKMNDIIINETILLILAAQSMIKLAFIKRNKNE